MRNLICLLFLFLITWGCDKEEAPECFRSAGEMTTREIQVVPFEELIVFGRINVFIEQGNNHKVLVRTGENLIDDITAEVEGNRLVLKNNIICNFFRDYNITEVHITVPNLTVLQNAGPNTIQSTEPLHFPSLWIKAFDQKEVDEIYTNGDYKLELISQEIRITSDNFSNFYITGKTGYFDVYFAAGNGRLEAAGLEADIINIQHRGTNTLKINPIEVLKGEIRSTGDVISVNRPAVVDVETFYTGDLIFDL